MSELLLRHFESLYRYFEGKYFLVLNACSLFQASFKGFLLIFLSVDLCFTRLFTSLSLFTYKRRKHSVCARVSAGLELFLLQFVFALVQKRYGMA